MKAIVELVTAWDAFEEAQPGATAEEFCRHFLCKKKALQTEMTKEDKSSEEVLPQDLDNVLAKLIGRIGAIQEAYIRLELKNEKELDIEWFSFLNTIYHFKETRKSDIISYNFAEHSTGIDILKRLQKMKLISERDDPEDKRAKLVKITSEGEKELMKYQQYLLKSASLIFHNVTADSKRQVIKSLTNAEIRHSRILSSSKSKSLDEIRDLVLGKEAIKPEMGESDKQGKVNSEKEFGFFKF